MVVRYFDEARRQTVLKLKLDSINIDGWIFYISELELELKRSSLDDMIRKVMKPIYFIAEGI